MRGHQRSDQFGQAGADGNDRQADERFRKSEHTRDAGRAVYRQLSADDDARKAKHDIHADQQRGHGDFLLLAIRCTAPLHGRADLHHQHYNKDRQQDQTLYARDRQVGRKEQKQQHSRSHRQRPVTPQQRTVHDERAQHGRQSRYHQQIKHIGAEHIADRDLVGALQGRRQADGELRRRRAEGNNGQADEQRRHAQPPCKGGCTGHKLVRAPHQQREAGHEHNK